MIDSNRSVLEKKVILLNYSAKRVIDYYKNSKRISDIYSFH